MSDVREYIGARYIPLFADPIEWDSTLSYEPLTVVKHQGGSYVSKQFVPEGIAITDERYWILWADFNAQLEQYRQEVQQFDGRITANANAISAETTAREAADTELNDYVATVEGLVQDNFDTLSDRISTEQGARIAADNTINNALLTKIQSFDNVAAMKNSTSLSNGITVHTNGFYNSGDGGGAFYKISDSGNANEMDVIALQNNLYAILVDNGYTANILKYGASNNGDVDISTIFNYVSQNKSVYIPIGVYLVENTLTPKHSVFGESYSRQPTTENATVFQSALNDGVIFDVDVTTDVQIRELTFKCNNTEDAIHYKVNGASGKITNDNISIFGLKGVGITAKNSDSFASRGIFITNTVIWGSSAYPDSRGMYLDSLNGDNRLDNIEIMGTKFGISFVNGIYYGGNIHIWNGCLAGRDNGSWWQATRAIDLGYGAKVQLSNLYVDTSHMMFCNLHTNGYDTTNVSISNFTYIEDSSISNVPNADGIMLWSSGGNPHIEINNAFLNIKESYKNKNYSSPNITINNICINSEVSFNSTNANALFPGNSMNNPAYLISAQTTNQSDNYIEVARVRLSDASGICKLFIGDISGNKNTELTITRNYGSGTISVSRSAIAGSTDSIYYKIENDILKIYVAWGAVNSTQYRKVQTLEHSYRIVPFEYGLAARQGVTYEVLYSSAGLVAAT